jgi:hypothetical protein
LLEETKKNSFCRYILYSVLVRVLYLCPHTRIYLSSYSGGGGEDDKKPLTQENGKKTLTKKKPENPSSGGEDENNPLTQEEERLTQADAIALELMQVTYADVR